MSRLVTLLGVGLVLLPAAVVTELGAPQEHAPRGAGLAARIPGRGEGWTSADRRLDEATVRYLRTDDYVYREYSHRDGSPLELMLVFSRSERKAVHPPEVCLEAQGWEIEDRGETRLVADDGREVPAAWLDLLRDGQRLRVLYWYAAGDMTTPSYLTHQAHVALAALRGEAEGSALVRLAHPRTDSNPIEAREALDDWASVFLDDVLDAL